MAAIAMLVIGYLVLSVSPTRKSNPLDVAGTMLSLALLIGTLFLTQIGYFHLAWSWLIVIGSLFTFILAYTMGPLTEDDQTAASD